MTRLRNKARRAFTMLEMMLALVLGALVIGACLSLFRVLDRSQLRQQARMEENMQLAHAHKVIGRACQSFLMAETNISEKDIETRLEEDDDRNSHDRADQRDEDAEAVRLSLQPDAAGGAMMSVQTDRGERLARSQTFLVTLRESPVVVGEDMSEDELLRTETERAIILQRALEKSGADAGKVAKELAAVAGSAMDSERGGEGKTGGSKSGKSGSKGSKGGSLGDAKALVDQALSGSRDAGGLSSDGEDLSASERLQEAQITRPRAPGVRGVFEILPDREAPLGSDRAAAPRPINADSADGQLYSLWWRELPPLASDEDLAENGISANASGDAADGARSADGSKSSSGSSTSRNSGRSASRRTDDPSSSASRTGGSASDPRNGLLRGSDAALADLAAESDFVGKRELLISGCKSIHWSALRGKKPRDKITAAYDRELPGYIELEFETATGRREKWMFEVAWVVGPEPGSIVPDDTDPLNALANGGGGNTINIDGVEIDLTKNPNDTTGGGKPGDTNQGTTTTGKPNPRGNPTTIGKPGTGNHTPIKINVDGHEIIINP